MASLASSSLSYSLVSKEWTKTKSSPRIYCVEVNALGCVSLRYCCCSISRCLIVARVRFYIKQWGSFLSEKVDRWSRCSLKCSFLEGRLCIRWDRLAGYGEWYFLSTTDALKHDHCVSFIFFYDFSDLPFGLWIFYIDVVAYHQLLVVIFFDNVLVHKNWWVGYNIWLKVLNDVFYN